MKATPHVRRSSAGFAVFAAAAGTLLLSLVSVASAKVHALNSQEQRLFKLIAKNSQQQRTEIKLDPILCHVARNRVSDMVARNYAAHVDPDGLGPNYHADKNGYLLPAAYLSSQDANYIESLFSGTSLTPAKVFTAWRSSPPHRRHVLAEDAFYQSQTRIGVGVIRKPGTTTYYCVFISAPPNLNPNPPRWILKSPFGKTIARTRPPKK